MYYINTLCTAYCGLIVDICISQWSRWSPEKVYLDEMTKNKKNVW